ncbi:hypothetical protein O3M35_006982 [Rhynocoris fuscipes]|uniref:Uncharacterized protein n=1 Tax=Rhynocoris fuscipes TaxID=488301 RepID=A0AAW1DLB6_9HEMI
MKCALALVTVFMLATLAYSYPSLGEHHHEEGEQEIWEPLGEITEEHVQRFKRASCDLFSFHSKWFTPNHSVCAAHSINDFPNAFSSNPVLYVDASTLLTNSTS